MIHFETRQKTQQNITWYFKTSQILLKIQKMWLKSESNDRRSVHTRYKNHSITQVLEGLDKTNYMYEL